MRMNSRPERVLLDTNVLITYLLDRQRKSPATPIVEAALVGRYRLLVSDELLHELASRVERKPYLASRIAPSDVDTLTVVLTGVAEQIDLSMIAIPRIVRDPDDDYLIALAVTGRADILVTGDHDLLQLTDLTSFRIRALRDFADLLDER